jgi:hypothetical protein
MNSDNFDYETLIDRVLQRADFVFTGDDDDVSASLDERRESMLSLLLRLPSLFIDRYFKFMDEQSRQFLLQTGDTDILQSLQKQQQQLATPEVTTHAALVSNTPSIATSAAAAPTPTVTTASPRISAQTRNRRLTYLRTAGFHDDYFSVESMRSRAPGLYESIVGDDTALPFATDMPLTDRIWLSYTMTEAERLRREANGDDDETDSDELNDEARALVEQAASLRRVKRQKTKNVNDDRDEDDDVDDKFNKIDADKNENEEEDDDNNNDDDDDDDDDEDDDVDRNEPKQNERRRRKQPMNRAVVEYNEAELPERLERVSSIVAVVTGSNSRILVYRNNERKVKRVRLYKFTQCQIQ